MFIFLLINKKFSKGEIKNLIEWFNVIFGTLRTMKLLDKLKSLGFSFATEAGVSLGFSDLLVPISINGIIKSGDFSEAKLTSKLINSNFSRFEYNLKITECWNEVSETIKKDIVSNFRESNLLNPLYLMLLSGARGNITQIKQLIGMRGLMVDSQGEIINVPIKSNLKNGLRSLEYFISCYGARKGVIDTAIKTANSGYLTRKLIYTSENMFVKKPDCLTKNCQLVLILKNTKRYYIKTTEDLLGRILAKNLIGPDFSLSEGQDICNFLAKKLMIFQKVYIRSPFTCKINEGVCQLCYGWNLSYGRMVELGENIGVIAAQSISEPATQLTMRTFHTGGIFSGSSADIIRAKQSGFLYYDIKPNGKILRFNGNEKVFMTLKSKKLVLINSTRQRLLITIPAYSIIYVRKGDRIFSNQIIAEISTWGRIKASQRNGFKTKIKVDNNTNISGITKLVDNQLCVVHGNVLSFFLLVFFLQVRNFFQIQNFFEQSFYSSITKISKTFISVKRKINLVPATFRNLCYFSSINSCLKSYRLFSHNVMRVSGKKFFINKSLGLKYISLGNFSPCNNFFFKEFKIGNRYTNNYAFQLIESQELVAKVINVNYTAMPKHVEKVGIYQTLISKQDKLFSSIFSQNKVGDIVQGLPAIEAVLENKSTYKNRDLITTQERLDYIYRLFSKVYSQKIAIRKSVYKIQKYLVNKIKVIYSEQNIKLSDKHIEVIVRQMTSKAIVKSGGDSCFIKGELVSLNKLEKINSGIFVKVLYLPLIVGISKLSLLNDSFLVAASFQQTFYTICTAALEGKSDWLHTLKGNIIVGNLVPVLSAYKNKNNIEGV